MRRLSRGDLTRLYTAALEMRDEARTERDNARALYRNQAAEIEALKTRIRLLEGASVVEVRGSVQYLRRLHRLARACARYRRDAAVQRRVTNRLANQLLDATGYQGEPLLAAARKTLGITTEVTK